MKVYETKTIFFLSRKNTRGMSTKFHKLSTHIGALVINFFIFNIQDIPIYLQLLPDSPMSIEILVACFFREVEMIF